MPLSLFFWFLFLLWVLAGFWQYPPAPGNWRPFGGHILLGILIFLLGWRVFGFIVKG